MASPPTRQAPPLPVTFTGSGGLRLAGDVRGDADAPPVLLVHASGQSRRSWATSAALLAVRGRRTVTFDLRGHGESEPAPGGAYPLDDFRDDLLAVIAELDTAPILIGASLGGWVALFAAAELDAAAVRGIVLVDSAHRGTDAGRASLIAFARSATDGYASVEEARAALAALQGGSGPPPAADRLRHVLREADGRYWWPWDPAFGEAWAAGNATETAAANADRVISSARALACPTLLARGAQSPLITDEIAREFRAAVPGMRRVDLPGVGHMLGGSDHAVFVEAIEPFLQDLPAAP